MGLVPMYFSAADFTVGEPNQGGTFELPPPPPPETSLKTLALADGEVSSYRLDLFDVAEELEVHLHGFSVTHSGPGVEG